MNVRANRYNDPNLGAAFEGLARVFAPPSAQDLAGYATANAKRQEAERLAWLFNNPNDPTASNRSSLTGVQGYGQTPDGYRYGVDTTAATARRGQDIGAAADLEKQRIAGQYGLAGQFMAPLAPGYVQPGLPDTVAGAFGVPAMPRTEGAPKPLSEAEQKAAERQRLQASGLVSDQMLADAIIGDQAPVKVVDPATNLPVFSTPGAAARTGAQAYVDVGSAPKPENGMALLRDGAQVPAVQDPATGRWRHAQTGAELPSDVRVFKTPAPTGTNEQLGVGTPANVTRGQMLVSDADYAMTRINEYENFLLDPKNAGAAGLPGTIQGFFQDMQAGVGELAAAYGTKGLPVEKITELADAIGVQAGYNPAVRAALNYAVEMAYLNAKMGDPGGEVNVAEFNRLFPIYSGGIGGNKAVLAALQPLKSQIEARRAQGANLIGGARDPATPTQPSPFANGALGGELPVVNSPEEAAKLPSGTRFKTPDGRIKVVP